MSGDKQFSFDIKRTLLLSEYINAWGIPQTRIVANKGDAKVEVYFFPSAVDGKVNRFATIGVSDHVARGTKADWELLMVTPADNAGATREEITSYMLDLFVYSIGDTVSFEVGATIDENAFAPKAWRARAVLVDDPRAEPECLSHLNVGDQCVSLRWMVPIHKSEFDAIRKHGLAVFDEAEAAAEWSPADPQRDPYL